MKTQTSKTRIWLSTLLVLPIIAVLFYNFAERVEVERESIASVETFKKQLIETEANQTPSQDKNSLQVYLKKYKQYESIRTSEPHYIHKSIEEQKQMDDLFSDLGGLYFRMSKENKSKVERPISPIRPYVKLTLNGKTYYKKYNELTAEERATLPPPPPPPAKQTSKGGPNPAESQSIYNPSFLEYIIEMENEDATFYLDNEEISAEEAKSIANNHSGKRIAMTTQKDLEGKYVVKLSSYEKRKVYARSINLKVLEDGSYVVDGIKATKSSFKDTFNQLHQDISAETRNKVMNIHVNASHELSNEEIWFIYNSLQEYGFYRIVTPNQEINRAKGNTPFAIESHLSDQEKATAKQVKEYNAWAKKINTAMAKASANNGKIKEYPIVKQRDLDKYKHIYNIMTAEQKKTAAAFPQGPPPPPPPSEKPFTSLQEQPIMYILINRNGDLMVNEEETSLEIIETQLKTLAKTKDDSKAVLVKYDPTDASNKVMKNVIALVRQYDFKVIREDASAPSNIPPPPPPPPAKPNKGKGGPSSTVYEMVKAQDNADTSKIKPVEILIKKDNSIILNDNPIRYNNLVEAVTKLNEQLTIDQRRTYVFASILVEKNKSIDFAQKVQAELRKAEIWSSSISYMENVKTSGLPSKHFNSNAGLTVKEAKIENEKLLKEAKDNKLPKNSPWSIVTDTAKVEYLVQDTEQKQGPIEIDGNTYYFTQKNGKTTYFDRFGKEVKLNNVLQQTSTNPSFLEYIEDMERQGASFYLENKKISAKEAKFIASNNKGKSTEMLTQLDDNGNYVVKLSNRKENKTVQNN